MSTATATPSNTAIHIPVGGRTWLDADLVVPPAARGAVLFVHGSGSSRMSPRNRFVASRLNALDIATVLAGLLTAKEDERSGALRFNIPLLTERLIRIVDWVRHYDFVATLPLGLFGASTGAAAALDAAAARPEIVRAIVSRGGRPDLASHLDVVTAPALFIAGGSDPEVIDLNTEALGRLRGTKELRVIPGATHLFEEPGALDAVASAAGAWFRRYLES